MDRKQLFNLFFVFFFVGGLAFFFVNDRSTESSLFGQAYGTLLGKVGQAISQASKLPKSDYNAVYNCQDRSYVVSGKRMGYGFGMKSDSLASRKRQGYGYGYCMNFQSYAHISWQCLLPEFKKVYECTPSSGYSCGNSRLSVISGIGYGYGFSRDSLASNKRSGWGFGKCASYDAYLSIPFSRDVRYFDELVRCEAGIK